MSQIKTPTNGGVSFPETTTTRTANLFSKQYIEINGLENRPTEWESSRRPIYRRLPASSGTYQTFFDEDDSNGYVYIPYGEGLFGFNSLEVLSTDNFENIYIKGGKVVTKYGTTSLYPALVNLKEVGIGSGKYLLAYETSVDETPFQATYAVTNYALTGTPLTLSASTDITPGWRFPPVNAFLNDGTSFWSNSDTILPSYAQPNSCYLAWQSDLPFSLSSVTLRCPTGTSFTGTAEIFYLEGTSWVYQETVTVKKDDTSQYYEFSFDEPTFQTGWKVEWSDLKVKIQSVIVSGQITELRKPSAPKPQSILVMYPINAVPDGKVLCNLAWVDVGSNFLVQDIKDVRNVTQRDFNPVTDWLTYPFDSDLVELKEEIQSYATSWLSPPTAAKGQYVKLLSDEIILT